MIIMAINGLPLASINLKREYRLLQYDIALESINTFLLLFCEFSIIHSKIENCLGSIYMCLKICSCK